MTSEASWVLKYSGLQGIRGAVGLNETGCGVWFGRFIFIPYEYGSGHVLRDRRKAGKQERDALLSLYLILASLHLI